VNRHTVRRALQALRDEGLVLSRRGAGVFVTPQPTEYRLGARVRFQQNLTAAGKAPGRTILALVTRNADPAEARALQIQPGDSVHACDGLSLADGLPIAVFRSIFPADSLPDLATLLRQTGSVTAALAAHGVADYTRAITRITACAADAAQAGHLGLPAGAPLLRTEAVNIDTARRPVEYGLTWFSGDRVTLTVPGSLPQD
jgi:GntR family phosphonate transport system transcriptional regulator